MLPNPQFPADLVTFTEEARNGKLESVKIFYKSVMYSLKPMFGAYLTSRIIFSSLLILCSYAVLIFTHL